MATASEVVPNTPLSGTELKKIILADFEKLIEADGMLSNHLAFGRVAYRLTVELQLANPLSPQSKTHTVSKRIARNTVEATDTEKAVEQYDEKAKPQVKGARQRRITSPNSERLRSGMLVPVQRRQQDGTRITEMVSYPKDESMGDGDVVEVVEQDEAVEQE